MTQTMIVLRLYNRPLFLISIFVVFNLFGVFQFCVSNFRGQSASNDNVNAAVSFRSTREPLALAPGDLPGYSGWARPFDTIAGLFDDHPTLLGSAHVGENVTVRTSCTLSRNSFNTTERSDSSCLHGGSLFYIRAYGRAVLPGLFIDYQNGTYDFIIFPLDDGLYTLEVVLAFSKSPPFDHFPLVDEHERPSYEGFLLPGFPLQIDVLPLPPWKQQLQHPVCSSEELLLKDTFESAIEEGRWVVTEKAVAMAPVIVNNKSTETDNRVSLRGYQNGLNSLGIRMDYAPRSCSLLSEEQAVHSFAQCSTKAIFHIIFIGDSNIKMQVDTLTDFMNWYAKNLSHNPSVTRPQIKTTRLSMYGGLMKTLGSVEQGLNSILASDAKTSSNSDVHYFVLFNSGLHDISQRCSHHGRTKKSDKHLSERPSCVEEYCTNLEKLIQLVLNFPARLRVFQTTTAGWPKFGNYGFAWPTKTTQRLPKDPTFVEYLNRVAWSTVIAKDYGYHNRTISVMDAYWLTLARPDHREVSKDQAIGKHLVHAGPEVLSVLVRKWIMLIVQDMCPENN